MESGRRRAYAKALMRAISPNPALCFASPARITSNEDIFIAQLRPPHHTTSQYYSTADSAISSRPRQTSNIILFGVFPNTSLFALPEIHKMSFLVSPMRRSAHTIVKRGFSTTQPSHLARMTLVGRLGTDPEVQQSSNGGSFVRYSVGTSYGSKDNRQTSWFRVAAFPPEGSAQMDYVMGLGKGYVRSFLLC
jgi:hypothetical protein